MAFLVLARADVERLLTAEACIEVMASALGALARGAFTQPLRSIYVPPGAPGVMAWMPAYRGVAQAIFGMKVLCVLPGNPARGLDGHQGAVLLLDGETGELRALVEASAITAIRTAAVSALATRLLARADARVLAVVGTGVQARRHLLTLPLVRPISRARVAGRTPQAARRLVEELRPLVPYTLEAVESAESAVRGADIVVTATTAREPVLQQAWLAPGTHLNAVGASQPTAREIDSATWAAARVFVDSRASVQREAGDFQRALADGVITQGHIQAELGEVLLGQAPGRTAASELTLFRSLGLAVEDVAAAQYLLEQARAAGAGTHVDF